MKSHYVRMKPKRIYYRDYKIFHKSNFLSDLKNTNFSFSTTNGNENYKSLTNSFQKVVNNHAPMKERIIRGNDAPFMNKEFRKAIYTRSRVKNKFFKKKFPSMEKKLHIKDRETNVRLFERKA